MAKWIRSFCDQEILNQKEKLLPIFKKTLSRVGADSFINSPEIFFNLVSELLKIRSLFFPEADPKKKLSEWHQFLVDEEEMILPVQHYHSNIRGWCSQWPFQEEGPWIYSMWTHFFKQKIPQIESYVNQDDKNHQFVVLNRKQDLAHHLKKLSRFKKPIESLSSMTVNESHLIDIAPQLSWSPFLGKNFKLSDEQRDYIQSQRLYELDFFEALSGGYKKKVWKFSYKNEDLGYLLAYIPPNTETLYWFNSYFVRSKLALDLGLGNQMLVYLLHQMYDSSELTQINLGLDGYAYKELWSEELQIMG